MNFNKIGNSEPRAWSQTMGTKFRKDEEDEDEIPVPYCDEFDDESEESEEEEEEEEEETVTETETETDTESTGSKKSKNPLKRIRCPVQNTVFIVLQEELDFMVE